MRVFVLCTGRSGSMTFIRACEKIDNFTAGHETNINEIGDQRFNYPENHIEADNRLVWFLGVLDKKFGKNAFYVYLRRNKEETVRSFMRRWNPRSIIWSFSKGILSRDPKDLNKEEKLKVCELYYNTVEENILSFLNDKPKKQVIELESIVDHFHDFTQKIDAKVNFENALKELKRTHNASSSPLKSNLEFLLYELKLKVNRLFRF